MVESRINVVSRGVGKESWCVKALWGSVRN